MPDEPVGPVYIDETRPRTVTRWRYYRYLHLNMHYTRRMAWAMAGPYARAVLPPRLTNE